MLENMGWILFITHVYTFFVRYSLCFNIKVTFRHKVRYVRLVKFLSNFAKRIGMLPKNNINVADLVPLLAHGLFGLAANPTTKSYG
jgi:uncharacterized membrane protein